MHFVNSMDEQSLIHRYLCLIHRASCFVLHASCFGKP